MIDEKLLTTLIW